MNILIISECSKQALVETRRVLDQFAERKGRRCWQTPITYEGMKTLRTLLKKSARKNTAVACYRIYGKNHTELMWVVGRRSKFNLMGTVPTNRTSGDVLRNRDENQMHSNQAIALMAAIAGLFHDFGKANKLFQDKLCGKRDSYEPYRHEWVSMHLFLAFVSGREDTEWLTALTSLNENSETNLLDSFDLQEDVIFGDIEAYSPLAAAIAWLIVSHHRLPQRQPPNAMNGGLDKINEWVTQGIGVEWNAINHKNERFTQEDKLQCSKFPFGLPFRSQTWRSKAQSLAKRALQLPSLKEYGKLALAYPMHVARMVLMLADHSYSSDGANEYWQDKHYKAFANTDSDTRKLKQKLDEHCVGVAHNAYLLAKALPSLRTSLPSVIRHPILKKRVTTKKFQWQNKAYDTLLSENQRSHESGLFVVLASSTGTGKTFAGAKMAYALSDPNSGCRFSVAMGLRSLTLQTGDALTEILKLDEDDIAVSIGSQAVKELYAQNKKNNLNGKSIDSSFTGSESQQSFDDDYIRYDGELDNNCLNRWLKTNRAANTRKLISAPISVSTIDHLVPATEGTRGGRQIGPMLRLMTSDLILDEPDDFDVADLPALCRLVHWAGLLGSRVILSSATLPPSLVSELFDAYQNGRKQYNTCNGYPKNNDVVSVWTDEFSTISELIADKDTFKICHDNFMEDRVNRLAKTSAPLHRGALIELSEQKENVLDEFAESILSHAQALSHYHHTAEGNKFFSAGLVRMANIEPMLAVANHILTLPPKTDTRIHYCVYHSQQPMLVRSKLEYELDNLLKRDSVIPITEHPIVKEILSKYSEPHQILIVLATPVAEVGRDHDYDWAIAEPSSMRSLIQLAGRVQRHRNRAPETPNILIFNKNFKACQKQYPAFSKPGFESREIFRARRDRADTEGEWLTLSSHDLCDASLLKNETINIINSSPRVKQPKPLHCKVNRKAAGFVELEHLALNLNLRDKGRVWWESPYAHLFGEIQRQTKFRASAPNINYVVDISEDGGVVKLLEWSDIDKEWIDQDKVVLAPIEILAERVSLFGKINSISLVENVSEEQDITFDQVKQRYFTVQLRELTAGKKWFYSPLLGLFEGKYKRLDN